MHRGTLQAPAIHPSAPPNALEASFEPSRLLVVGFRVPVLEGADQHLSLSPAMPLAPLPSRAEVRWVLGPSLRLWTRWRWSYCRGALPD